MAEKYAMHELVMCRSNKADKVAYPAKIIGTRPGKGGEEYLIHFNGWNSRHDTWLDKDGIKHCLMKHTPELEEQHKQILREMKGVTAKTPVPKTADGPGRKRKRVDDRDGSVESHASTVTNQDVNVAMPDKLRALLMDDNDLISRQFKLVKLPAKYTVDAMIKEYGDHLRKNGSLPESGNDEVLSEYPGGSGGEAVIMNKHDMIQSSLGVIDYFNVTCGSQLLYKVERKQYHQCTVAKADEMVKLGGRTVDIEAQPELENLKIVPSSLYGLPHLIRLFVRIGPLIAQGQYNEKSRVMILKHLHDLLVFLSKNVSKYSNLDTDYIIADPALTKTDD